LGGISLGFLFLISCVVKMKLKIKIRVSNN
jgi:hypothetical protein